MPKVNLQFVCQEQVFSPIFDREKLKNKGDLSISYYCNVQKYRITQPHRVCPNRITKALKLFPRCVFCNLRGSQVEGLRTRLGWSKREMARRLQIPWKTYQEISTFKRSGKRSDIYSKVQELIDSVLDSPGKYISPKMIQELTTSPLDFFNKVIGEFPWEESEKWPSPIWTEESKMKTSNGVGAKSSKVANKEQKETKIRASAAL